MKSNYHALLEIAILVGNIESSIDGVTLRGQMSPGPHVLEKYGGAPTIFCKNCPNYLRVMRAYLLGHIMLKNLLPSLVIARRQKLYNNNSDLILLGI